jgi:hypothetical protein
MISFELLKDAGVLIVEPRSALSTEDFREISRTIDPYIGEKGKLTVLLIEAASFPGWDSFGALIDHLKFVHDHHRKIDRVAAATDAAFLKNRPHDSPTLCTSGDQGLRQWREGEGARMVASLTLSEARPSCRTRHRHCRCITSGA